MWYRERSEIAARNFVAELDRAVELVTESPERWPSGEHGIRKFVLRRFPFAIIYRITEAKIQILALPTDIVCRDIGSRAADVPRPKKNTRTVWLGRFFYLKLKTDY